MQNSNKQEKTDLDYVEDALKMAKAAIQKFVPNAVINGFIEKLSSDEKESFTSFWGFGFIPSYNSSSYNVTNFYRSISKMPPSSDPSKNAAKATLNSPQAF